MATSNDDQRNQPAHPNLPTIDESSPAYPESGITPRRPNRGATDRQLPAAAELSRAVDGEGLLSTEAAGSSADTGLGSATAPTPPSRDHQAVRPNVDIDSPLDVTPRVGRTTRDEPTSTASPAYPPYNAASRAPARSRSGRAASTTAPVGTSQTVSTSGGLLNDQGGPLVGVAEPYQPFINPTEAPTPISEPSPASPEQQQLWTKDLSKQKLEQLKATRRSVAQKDTTQQAKTSNQAQSPQDPLSQSVNAANSYDTQATRARAARYGTVRALRNAEGKSTAEVEQLAKTVARDFILMAQRRAWQAAQEVAEDTTLGTLYMIFITGPVVAALYVTRWVGGNMFGEMLTREVGGISIPLVPGYAIGDLVDYSHHVKSLLISLVTIFLYGFLIMLFYYWTHWTATFALTLDAGVRGGWQYIIDLLGKVQP